MSAPFPFGFTVSVIRNTRNQFGDKTRVVHHSIDGCAWAPRTSTEEDNGRTSVITGLQLYGPPRPDILFDDEIVLPQVMGLPADEKKRTFRVVGEIGEWRNPFTGWEPGFEVALERVS